MTDPAATPMYAVLKHPRAEGDWALAYAGAPCLTIGEARELKNGDPDADRRIYRLVPVDEYGRDIEC